MSLRSRINDDVKTAMRAGDTRRRDALRLLLAALKQREVDERKELTDADVIAVIDKMIKQRRDSIAQFEQDGRQDLADAEKFEIERGGDVTYHGPGQLVGYPLLNLSHFNEDLGWYLRALEETIIRVLAGYGIESFRVEGRTGVWVRGISGDEKICAIGIKASRWCTMHGFAFNINTDLSYFERIVPCGISDKKVTSLSQVLGRSIAMAEVRERYADAFSEVFSAELFAQSTMVLN